MTDVPIRDGKNALVVNWLELEIANLKEKATQRFSFITDLPVDRDTAVELAACGHTRWKIENETFIPTGLDPDSSESRPYAASRCRCRRDGARRISTGSPAMHLGSCRDGGARPGGAPGAGVIVMRPRPPGSFRPKMSSCLGIVAVLGQEVHSSPLPRVPQAALHARSAATPRAMARASTTRSKASGSIRSSASTASRRLEPSSAALCAARAAAS